MNHIITLIEQNIKLSDELEVILERDDDIIGQLNRKEKIGTTIIKYKVNVENSKTNLDSYKNDKSNK
jgi:hypothetical protein